MLWICRHKMSPTLIFISLTLAYAVRWIVSNQDSVIRLLRAFNIISTPVPVSTIRFNNTHVHIPVTWMGQSKILRFPVLSYDKKYKISAKIDNDVDLDLCVYYSGEQTHVAGLPTRPCTIGAKEITISLTALPDDGSDPILINYQSDDVITSHVPEPQNFVGLD